MLGKNFSRSDQHGRVTVMTTYVPHARHLADTVFFFQKITGILLNRQCIYIRPQKHRLAGGIPFYNRQDSAVFHLNGGKSGLP